ATFYTHSTPNGFQRIAFSKHQLKAQLNVSARRGGRNCSECFVRARETPEGDRRVVEVCPVESVEEVSLELQLDPFGGVKHLSARQIPELATRTGDDSNARVPKPRIRRRRERIGVEPQRRSAQRRKALDRSSDIGGSARANRSRRRRREIRTALQVCDAAELPSRKHRAPEAFHAAEKGQPVGVSRNENMTPIKGRR